jgi:hypothetical protein
MFFSHFSIIIELFNFEINHSGKQLTNTLHIVLIRIPCYILYFINSDLNLFQVQTHCSEDENSK